MDDSLADELVAMSDGFCGADIESACREIGKESIRMSNGGEPDDDFLRLCFRNIVPLVRTNPERIEQIREWGREPRALGWEGQWADESHMVLDLREAG